MPEKINLHKITTPKNNITFNSKENYLFNGIDRSLKPLDTFVKSQENLKVTRFIQDVVTNWLPKVVFTRSLADFTEMSFLEFTESALFYFIPAVLGGVFYKVFSKLAPKNLREDLRRNIAKPADTILKDTKLAQSGVAKRVLPLKAAIILACASIPAAEYALSFAKNLLTLKVFKKSDFNNVVNLNKNQTENEEHQEKVRKSAKNHIKKAGVLSLGGLGAGFIFARYGHKSELLQGASSLILQPGKHLADGLKKAGVHSGKLEKFLKKYITPDFDEKNGKLTLSKGQLLISTASGFFGYSEAGKDRGKLDRLEVWTRVPFVVLYTTFGSAIFDQAFNHIFVKKNKFSDLIKKAEDGSVKIPSRAELPELATKIAKAKNTLPQTEFNRLLREKAIITAIPYGFSLIFMGFLLAGITRFWTQYRYNRTQKNTVADNIFKNFTGADAGEIKKFMV
ncbi:MAG: hypothetical protein WCY19_08125 [Candidatus Gastranaerophilaceae bacterium]